MNLPRLKNNEFDRVNDLANQLGIPLTQCPTCLSKPIETEEREVGFYRYKGKRYFCDCLDQIQLRKHYMLAGIPDQYMRLAWTDFRGNNEEMKDNVATYLDKWQSFKLHGMGFEFASKGLGTGKTFAATYLGKELVKRGERVYFIPFSRTIGVLSRANPDWEWITQRMYESTILILDDVMPPDTMPQGDLFRSKLEELIRNRTDYNRINIITTNMTTNEMAEIYPRPYSLLSAKQIRVELTGDDARQKHIADENLELAMNEEIRPLD